jgi:hypothetical protein
MRTLRLILSVCLLSACATTVPQSPPASPAVEGTSAAMSVDASDSGRRPGRRAALWSGIGFALFAIYEANDGDDYMSPTPTAGCLSLKCF